VAVPASTSSSARGSWSWALAGLALGLVASLVLFLPASWVAAQVAQASSGRVQLSDARGTLWSGSGRLLLTGGAGSADELALPSPVDWRVRPRWDGLRIELSTACCTSQPVVIRLNPGWRGIGIEIEDGQTQWPAALLAGLGTPWNTLQLDGDLTLLTQGLSVEWFEGRMAIAGRAELMAQRLSSRLSTLKPMGSYRITVVGGDTPTLQLETMEGSLQLNGSGQWVGSRLRFSGVATAAPEREDALSNLLNIIGRRSGARSIISIG
jgi:general secretion pathway protein N